MMVNVKNVGHVVRNPPARRLALLTHRDVGVASQAYECVYVAPGKADGVAKAMARHRGVKAAHAYWDRPDVIA
jgi:hypothetical protein